MSRSQAGASCAVDDPGGSVDDPGGGNTDDLGSFSNLAISTATSPKTERVPPRNGPPLIIITVDQKVRDSLVQPTGTLKT